MTVSALARHWHVVGIIRLPSSPCPWRDLPGNLTSRAFALVVFTTMVGVSSGRLLKD